MRAALPLVVLALVSAVAVAQPAPADKPDFARAAALYKEAEAEMAAGAYADAARDYAIAYDITKDPVLFFKIASAHDKAGRCDVALTYYRRYLAEGKPDAEFEQLTRERVAACEQPVTGTQPDPGTTTGTTTGEPATGNGTGTGAGIGAELERPSLAAEKPSRRRGMAWIALGVGIAAGTVGVVSAMSAEAAEKDLQDLYDLRIGGRPADWTADTQRRYDDLIAQGDQYQTLAWVGFGVAGAAFVGATVLFLTSGGDDRAEAPPVSVRVTGSGATVSGGWSF